MSVPLPGVTTAVEASSTVAVSLPGPDVFAVAATVALVLAVATMIYFAFSVGRGPDLLEEAEDDSTGNADTRDRAGDDARESDGDDARTRDESQGGVRAESS